MFYVQKAKTEILGENEYSSEVLRVQDVAPYLENGYTEATRQEWELVQSDEVKAAIANGEYSDEPGAAVPETPEITEPVVEPIAE